MEDKVTIRYLGATGRAGAYIYSDILKPWSCAVGATVEVTKKVFLDLLTKGRNSWEIVKIEKENTEKEDHLGNSEQVKEQKEEEKAKKEDPEKKMTESGNTLNKGLLGRRGNKK